MKCLWCGTELKILFRASIRKFCCDSCKNKYYAKLRSGEDKVKTCLECGKVLEGRQKRYCCEECRYQAQIKRQMLINKTEHKKPKTEEYPEEPKRKPTLSVEDICKLARSENSSYGKIVAKYGL